MAILVHIDRAERRRMQKAIRKTRDKDYARRLMTLLMLHGGMQIKQVHEQTGAARSSIGRWINWFTDGGMEALRSQTPGRPPQLPMQQMLAMLTLLIQMSPQELGYQRSRWSTELMAIELNRLFESSVAASTVRRWLPHAGIV